MPLTRIDPVCALIVVDLQQGIVASYPADVVASVVRRASDLASGFRRRGLPVVLVRVTGRPGGRTDAPSRHGTRLQAGFADLVPELALQPGDRVITKNARSAFTDTDLRDHLAAVGATQVVIAGIATSSGVESTARDAHDRGLNVVLALDAMADHETLLERHSIAQVFPRLGEVDTTHRILEMLNAGDS